MKNDLTQILFLRRNFMTFRKFLLVGIVLLFQLNVLAQQKSVSGTVRDKSNAPLAGVTVIVKGTSIGFLTDINGKFTLNIPSAGATLAFSSVGMQSQEIAVDTSNVYDVILVESTTALDDVVVVGYGTQKRKELTGAITSVSSKDLKISAEPNLGQMIQGKAAGLQVIQNSAQPGGEISFNIRGYGSINSSNDPLIVIDGYPITNENNEPNAAVNFFQSNGQKATALNSLNSADIESVEILKDASATAIYGSRAGHGVILITTKKGKEGNLTVNYSTSFGIQKAYGVPKVLNGKEFLTEVNKALYENWLVDNAVAPYGSNQASDISNPFIPRFTQGEINTAGTGTDWFKEISRNGSIQQHNLSLTGGTPKIKYLISGNVFDQKGIIKTNDFKRFTGRINLDFNFNKFIRAGVRTSGSSIKNNNINIGSAYDEAAGIMMTAMQFNPSLPIKDENGNYTHDPYAPTLENPVAMLDLKNVTTNKRLFANSFIEIEPIKDLIGKFTAGFDYSAGNGASYAPSTTDYGARLGGRAGQSYSEIYNYQYDFTLNYKKVFAKVHSFDFLAGASYQKFLYNGFSAANSKFLTDNLLWYNLALGQAPRPTVNSWGSTSETASLFGRMSYSYASKYLLSATLRYDGSSNFAQNHQWGLFPSVAFAWRAIEENFMKDQNFFSDLKLRVSYGNTGNQGIGNGAFAYYGIGYPYSFNNVINTGVALQQLANPGLKWETTTELNFGIDVGMLKDRISFTGEYFNRITSDLLATRTLPYYQEINTVAANIGATKSSGFELTIKTRVIENKDFTWNSSLSFSFYRDSWKERDPKWVPAIYESYNDPLRPLFSHVSDGLIKDINNIPAHMPFAFPGQIQIKDIDGYKTDSQGNILYDNIGRALRTGMPDGKLDDADIVLKFVNDPYLLGFNNTVTFHGFDLSFYIYSMFHRMDVSPWDIILLEGSQRLRTDWNMSREVLNRWSYDHTDGKYNSAVLSTYPSGDFYYQNTSFIRIKNISLGYTLPSKLLKVQNFRVYVEALNPFLFTKYTGSDPETDFTNVGPYPNQRTYSMGLNVTF